MPHRTLRLATVLALVAAAPVWAQGSPPGAAAAAPSTPAREVPLPDQLEPGVDTSAAPPSSAAPESTTPGAQTSKDEPRASGEAQRTPKETVAKAPAKPSNAASPNANGANNSGDAKTAARGKTGDKAHDSIQLDTTDITGNRELPKVLYIVPWKRSDLGDLVGKPANSLLDEVLAPVDRDVFKRENRYYDALKPDAGGTSGPAAAAPPAAGAAPEGGGKP
jgi:hypothetical protein